MRDWQVERRKRTRHLIELGGLVVKSGVVELTGDDRAVIYGALLWAADKLKSDERNKVLALWGEKGPPATPVPTIKTVEALRRRRIDVRLTPWKSSQPAM